MRIIRKKSLSLPKNLPKSIVFDVRDDDIDHLMGLRNRSPRLGPYGTDGHPRHPAHTQQRTPAWTAHGSRRVIVGLPLRRHLGILYRPCGRLARAIPIYTSVCRFVLHCCLCDLPVVIKSGLVAHQQRHHDGWHVASDEGVGRAQELFLRLWHHGQQSAHHLLLHSPFCTY